MEKIIIQEETRNEILYKFNSGISIRKLEIEYPYSFTFIQKLIQSHKNEQQILANYPQKEGCHIVAVCKRTQKEYYDYKNESGVLTGIIFMLYPEESKKSKYIRIRFGY